MGKYRAVEAFLAERLPGGVSIMHTQSPSERGTIRVTSRGPGHRSMCSVGVGDGSPSHAFAPDVGSLRTRP